MPHLAGLDDSVAVLIREVACEPQSAVRQNIALRIQVHGGLCNRGAGQDAAILCQAGALYHSFGALRLAVLDRCAFVHGHEAVRIVLQKGFGGLGPFGRGQRFDVHYEDMQDVALAALGQGEVAEFFLILLGDVGLPPQNLMRNTIRQVNRDFCPHPVVKHALWRNDQGCVD